MLNFGTLAQNLGSLLSSYAVQGRKPKTVHDVAVVKTVDEQNNTSLTVQLSKDVLLGLFGSLGEVISLLNVRMLAVDAFLVPAENIPELFPEANVPDGADFFLFATRGSGITLRLFGCQRVNNHNDPSTLQGASFKLSLRSLPEASVKALHGGANPMLFDLASGQLVAARINPDLL